jgi:signal transduction histidine kinase
MNRSLIDLNLLIRQVGDLYLAQKNQPVVSLDLEETLPQISVDAVRMRQVLHNLIRNALEALDEQEDGEVVIKTRTLQAGDIPRVEITVTDNGPGLPPEVSEQIFDPYVTSKPKGTGLGLAIVKKLVEEHGGEVGIESEPGQGACVTIILPVAEADESGQGRKATGKPGKRRQSA